MSSWRTILSWEVDKDEPSPLPPYTPSRQLLERYKNTWWAEVVNKYQIDCSWTVEHGFHSLSTRLEPWSIMLRSPFNRRELFQCFNSTKAAEAASTCKAAALDCTDPRYEVVVEKSSMPHYISIEDVYKILGKNEEDIHELFQDEPARGLPRGI